MIYCRYCGSKNNGDALYCRGCSAPFHDEYNQPKPKETLPELYNNPYVSGSLAFFGMPTNYYPSGSAVYFGNQVNQYVRTSIITPDEAREFLEIPHYETRLPTRIEDLPDIKLLDKIKNKLMDWRNKGE